MNPNDENDHLPKFITTVGETTDIKTVIKDGFLLGYSNPRIAFVGRSNVGKSSLINALMGGKNARVSKKPGKTRTIQFYFWRKTSPIIVDLPGYGFAKVSQKERASWERLMSRYFKADTKLQAALVLLDARHGPSDLDLGAIEYLIGQEIPIVFILTKADQLKNQSMRAKRQKEVAEILGELGYDSSKAFWISSLKKQGIKELDRFLNTEV